MGKYIIRNKETGRLFCGAMENMWKAGRDGNPVKWAEFGKAGACLSLEEAKDALAWLTTDSEPTDSVPLSLGAPCREGDLEVLETTTIEGQESMESLARELEEWFHSYIYAYAYSGERHMVNAFLQGNKIVEGAVSALKGESL